MAGEAVRVTLKRGVFCDIQQYGDAMFYCEVISHLTGELLVAEHVRAKDLVDWLDSVQDY